MKRTLCCACGAVTLAFVACTEDNAASWSAVTPVADVSSSSLAEFFSSSLGPSSSSLLGLSSSSLAESSSSSFGLSSSGPAAESSSFAELSSSSAVLSSSSSLTLSSSSSMCAEKSFEVDGLGGAYARVCAWPENAVPDFKWRIMETDSADGGKSSLVWEAGTSENGEVPDSTYIECGAGVCGTAILSKGTLTYNPLESVGFTLARDESGKTLPVDVSNWGGFCFFYQCDTGPDLVLDLGDSVNAMLGYALPRAPLPKTTGMMTRKCVKWEDFEFPSWYKKLKEAPDGWLENTGVRASKQLVGVMFRILSVPGKYKFAVYDFESYDMRNMRFYFYWN